MGERYWPDRCQYDPSMATVSIIIRALNEAEHLPALYADMRLRPASPSS